MRLQYKFYSRRRPKIAFFNKRFAGSYESFTSYTVIEEQCLFHSLVFLRLQNVRNHINFYVIQTTVRFAVHGTIAPYDLSP